MYTTRPKTRFGLPHALLPYWMGAPAHVWGYPPLLPSLLARFGRASSLPCARFGLPFTRIFLVLGHFFFPSRFPLFLVCCRSPPTLLSSEINIFAPRSLLFVYLST